MARKKHPTRIAFEQRLAMLRESGAPEGALKWHKNLRPLRYAIEVMDNRLELNRLKRSWEKYEKMATFIHDCHDFINFYG